MIDHLGINCADWDRSKAFYDNVLGVLGYTRQMDFEVAIGYGKDGKPDFWIADMSAGDAAGPNRENHVAFQANDTDAVQAFYDAALEQGAESLHAPRLWPEYHPGYFGAFVRDPDGNNVEAVFHGAQARRLDPQLVGVFVAQRFPPMGSGVLAYHPRPVHTVSHVVQHVEAQMPACGVHRGMVPLAHGLLERQPTARLGW